MCLAKNKHLLSSTEPCGGNMGEGVMSLRRLSLTDMDTRMGLS